MWSTNRIGNTIIDIRLGFGRHKSSGITALLGQLQSTYSQKYIVHTCWRKLSSKSELCKSFIFIVGYYPFLTVILWFF